MILLIQIWIDRVDFYKQKKLILRIFCGVFHSNITEWQPINVDFEKMEILLKNFFLHNSDDFEDDKNYGYQILNVKFLKKCL